MPRSHLTVVFRLDALAVDIAIAGIQKVLVEHQAPLQVRLSEELVKLSEVPARLKKQGRKHFNLIGQDFEFDLGIVRNSNLDFLEIQSTAGPTIPWDAWVSPFISDPNFVMAWVADSEYEHWQNATDPLQYTAVGKSYAHLPMRSNDLPYPLEKQIIDTSANPGRRCLRNGYIEVVGGMMWLGEPFWMLTGASKDRVENSFTWLQISYPAPGVMRIQVDEGCFMLADGISSGHQNGLRAVLFPNVVPVNQ